MSDNMAKKSSSSEVTLNDLPDDILVYEIMSRLSPKTAKKLGSTTQTLRAAQTNKKYFKHQLAKEFYVYSDEDAYWLLHKIAMGSDVNKSISELAIKNLPNLNLEEIKNIRRFPDNKQTMKQVLLLIFDYMKKINHFEKQKGTKDRTKIVKYNIYLFQVMLNDFRTSLEDMKRMKEMAVEKAVEFKEIMKRFSDRTSPEYIHEALRVMNAIIDRYAE